MGMVPELTGHMDEDAGWLRSFCVGSSSPRPSGDKTELAGLLVSRAKTGPRIGEGKK
jgi:hypothetical protein